MVEVTTQLTGPFPRSEALVSATRDLDRGRTSLEAVEELYRSTEDEVFGIERRLGLSPSTGGYLRWADLFRPLTETWTGFTVGPVTRWFETNTFYRQPILTAPPERAPGALDRWLPRAPKGDNGARAKVILPGPFTFARMLDNRSGETPEALTHRLGRLLAEEVRSLRARGYATLQFQEPLLVVEPPTGAAAESVVAAYEALKPALEGAQSIVWTFFGDAAPAASVLRRLPVSVVGFDLAETDLEKLPSLGEHRGVGLGCIDPRTTLIEDPGELVHLAKQIMTKLRPSSLLLGPGAGLDLLPWEPATRKLHTLPAARQLLVTEGRNG
jgi:5-methyltetrahydropteroyltriglutamate--homocysteine methyltransferase